MGLLPLMSVQLTVGEPFQTLADEKAADKMRGPLARVMLPFLIVQGAAVIASCVSYPFETVCNRLQMQVGEVAARRVYVSTQDCVAKILAEEGILGFYQG